MKKLTAMVLALAMAVSLASCGKRNDPGDDSGSGDEKPEEIVLWTLSNDLKQFAERYEEQTGNRVEVVVFNSAYYEGKVMQTLRGSMRQDVDVFVGEPQMLPNFYQAGFCADLSALEWSAPWYASMASSSLSSAP